jgi:GNAT superfamily N-acetyltransferase
MAELLRLYKSKWKTWGNELFDFENKLFGLIRQEFDDFYRRILKSRSLIWIGAFRDGKIVGHIVGRGLQELADDSEINFMHHEPEERERTIYLENFVVAPELQNNGIGNKFVWSLLYIARRKGFSRIAGHFSSPPSAYMIVKNKHIRTDVVRQVADYYYDPGKEYYYCSGRICD